MIIYRINEDGKCIYLAHKNKGYILAEGDKTLEGDRLPEIETLHEQRYLDYLASIQYKENRAKEYASISDQLDMQYWDSVNGTSTWKDHIASVKSKYPKG